MCAGEYWIVAWTVVDQNWGLKGQGEPKGKGPQSFLANARTNTNFKKTNKNAMSNKVVVKERALSLKEPAPKTPHAPATKEGSIVDWLTSPFAPPQQSRRGDEDVVVESNSDSATISGAGSGARAVKGRRHWPSDPIVVRVHGDGSIFVESSVLECAWWTREAHTANAGPSVAPSPSPGTTQNLGSMGNGPQPPEDPQWVPGLDESVDQTITVVQAVEQGGVSQLATTGVLRLDLSFFWMSVMLAVAAAVCLFVCLVWKRVRKIRQRTVIEIGPGMRRSRR